VLVGDLRLAHELVEAIAGIAKTPDGRFAGAAAAGLTRLSAGPLVKHLVLFLRQATDPEVEVAGQFCRTIGPALIAPLALAVAVEDNSRTVRRLRDLLIAFGRAARAHANELRNSKSPAVRRAAIELLRALGGEEALPDLRALLDDAEAQVQRDALRAIVQIGTPQAYASLEQALESGAPRTRDAIMQALGSLRDERAAPLFVYILKHSNYRGGFEPVYSSAIESLGRLATDRESVDALKEVLYRSEFWAPKRTVRLRAVAARALRTSVAADAETVLQEAVAGGPRGVRHAARTALALPKPRPIERGERKDS
jgi:HEAT repeat protein